MLETGELLENYQGSSNSTNVGNIKELMADIMTYCLLMCDRFGFDARDIIIGKMKVNRRKFPIDGSYGMSDKYNILNFGSWLAIMLFLKINLK